MTTLAQARSEAMRAHPSAPLVTDCTQGRVELSHATFDNWVTKVVNFLQLEVDLEPGSVVAMDLPLHWMTAVWCVAVWEAGCDLAPGSGPADLTVGTESGVDVLVTADPLGMAPVPAGVDAQWHFPADVRMQPDQPVLGRPATGSVVGMSATELFQASVTFAKTHGLDAGGRMLTQRPTTDLEGVLAAIAAPLAVDACVIYGDAGQQEQPTASA